MSRQPPRPQRSLTLPEELEKLEQSITLTLQEIDSNFSKAHRIVTTSILPIVEEYAKHSSDVWEGSKFWKQFFEASANVSLSGYEEAAVEEEDMTGTEATTTELETPEGYARGGAQEQEADDEDQEEEFTVDSPTQVTGVQTTPKLSSAKNPNGNNAKVASTKPTAASFRSPSPRKYTGKNPLAAHLPPSSEEEPSTPRAAQSSPFEPESAAYRPSAQRNNNDPLLHRGVLDKNYRVAATPHTQRRRQQQPQQATASKATPARGRVPWDSSPQSSPAVPAPPQLRSDLFSPEKRAAPRTPGISVLTPALHKTHNTRVPTTSTGRKLFSPQDKTYTSTSTSHHAFSPDSDEDDSDWLSPPQAKTTTMNFSLPQGRLLQTPAREASRRIVEELLLTAGAEGTEEIEGLDGGEEIDMGDREGGEEGEKGSPSVVRRVDDDTF